MSVSQIWGDFKSRHIASQNLLMSDFGPASDETLPCFMFAWLELWRTNPQNSSQKLGVKCCLEEDSVHASDE